MDNTRLIRVEIYPGSMTGTVKGTKIDYRGCCRTFLTSLKNKVYQLEDGDDLSALVVCPILKDGQLESVILSNDPSAGSCHGIRHTSKEAGHKIISELCKHAGVLDPETR